MRMKIKTKEQKDEDKEDIFGIFVLIIIMILLGHVNILILLISSPLFVLQILWVLQDWQERRRKEC
ncbi:MAG: hypothetical protein H3Z53_03060 [archaeon]|nr:hypothetical protein [archaeon]